MFLHFIEFCFDEKRPSTGRYFWRLIDYITHPSVVMVTNAHHIPSIGPRMGEEGNSSALKKKSCWNEKKDGLHWTILYIKILSSKLLHSISSFRLISRILLLQDYFCVLISLNSLPFSFKSNYLIYRWMSIKFISFWMPILEQMRKEKLRYVFLD